MVTIPARQARAFRVIDNRTSELTSWDTDLLPDALSGLNDLDIFSFDNVLPLAVTAGKTNPDDIPETPKNPVTRTGNLWVLWKHRIVCGDSTDQKTVERLLDGAEPDLMVTDPPYGVNYDATWRYKAGVSSKDGAFGKSANDDTSDWQDAYALFPGLIAYVWMSGLGLPVAASGLDACGFIRRCRCSRMAACRLADWLSRRWDGVAFSLPDRCRYASRSEPVSRYAAHASYAGSLSVVSLSQGSP